MKLRASARCTAGAGANQKPPHLKQARELQHISTKKGGAQKFTERGTRPPIICGLRTFGAPRSLWLGVEPRVWLLTRQPAPGAEATNFYYTMRCNLSSHLARNIYRALIKSAK